LVKDNDAAIGHLGRIVDAILLHNRRIERRIDDSVVQVAEDGRCQVFRRARGYAPQPIRLPAFGHHRGESPAVLAVGAELKNTICFLRDGRGVLSEHIGDLKDGRVYRHFIDTIDHLGELFAVGPQLLAADLHPQYLSTGYAMKWHRGELAGKAALPIVHVQHHHAHIVACMADNDRSEPVIGLACDGVGHGDDGAAWGCEILRADFVGYDRLGHLNYMPLIGGDAASSETYRPAVAALWETFGGKCGDFIKRMPLFLPRQKLDAALEMLTLGANCPPSSSLGRWFDAVAWMCGLATENRYEGEAPMRLQAAIAGGVEDAYGFALRSSGPFMIDLAPMVEGIVFDLMGGLSAPKIAAKFHNTVVRFLASAARRGREETGLNVVALSGGCFANRYLTGRLIDELSGDGFQVLTHRNLPCNDGAVSLGQAVVALARKSAEAARLRASTQDTEAH
jgi:hydrogenase maturation protein HypF